MTDKTKPEAIADEALDQAQGGASKPVVTRSPPDLLLADGALREETAPVMKLGSKE